MAKDPSAEDRIAALEGQVASLAANVASHDATIVALVNELGVSDGSFAGLAIGDRLAALEKLADMPPAVVDENARKALCALAEALADGHHLRSFAPIAHLFPPPLVAVPADQAAAV